MHICTWSDELSIRATREKNPPSLFYFLNILPYTFQGTKSPGESNSQAINWHGKMYHEIYEGNINCGTGTVSFHVTRKKSPCNNLVSYRYFRWPTGKLQKGKANKY